MQARRRGARSPAPKSKVGQPTILGQQVAQGAAAQGGAEVLGLQQAVERMRRQGAPRRAAMRSSGGGGGGRGGGGGGGRGASREDRGYDDVRTDDLARRRGAGARARGGPARGARRRPQNFDTPQAAADAVVAALEAKDRDELIAIFGPENEDVILTGDAAKDRENWSEFLRDYKAMHEITPTTRRHHRRRFDRPRPLAVPGARW